MLNIIRNRIVRTLIRNLAHIILFRKINIPWLFLLPSNITTIPNRYGYRRGRGEGDNRELIVFLIDIKLLFEDCISGTDNIIKKVQMLVKKRSRRT